MLTEDEVIDAVRDHLLEQGWRVLSRATAIQHGDDLIAERDGVRFEIEAKGATSSKKGSRRYGEPFNKSQVFDHVAKALLKALRVTSRGDDLAGIALPDNADHRAEITRVEKTVAQLCITVFWVSNDGVVSRDGAVPNV
jgi:Holliday junction resolvase-like predicted endonuclease